MPTQVTDYAVLIAPFIGWILAQGFKFVFTLRKDGITLSDAIKSGGMPSSHSAFMMALVTAIAIQEGLSSVAFAISFALACIVMYDAAGVRRTTGDQTDAIHQLAKQAKTNVHISHDARGHSLAEVLAGAATGVLAGWLTVVIL